MKQEDQMKMHRTTSKWLVGAALLALPAAAVAQDNASVAGSTSDLNASTTTGTTNLNSTTADPAFADDTLNASEPYTEVRDDDDDDDFPWGLLGLLGLAGLLGRKRHDAADIHVDARHDKRP
jgi:MYXO-CTERM domain-containing protein